MAEEPRYSEETFEGWDGSRPGLAGRPVVAGAIMVGCAFVDCSLGEMSFRGSHLSECRFERCDVSLADFTDTVFQGVVFDSCRLTGNHFDTLKTGALGIMAGFDGCDLSYCSFRKMDLTACSFTNCTTADAEFVQCELEGVSFDGTDLTRCTFHANNLMGADLRGARNYVISPFGNRVEGMRVAMPEALSLLLEVGVDLS
ncbi:MAG TPA: pentapeptide repeat-containing protein [Trueperaceae bacterium]|nr:pentapeptide repeat-containing protein [Trueperaceae bacterium]